MYFRIFLFCILILLINKKNIEYFQVEPILSGIKIERYRLISDFIGEDIVEREKKTNNDLDQLYMISDKIDTKLNSTNKIFSDYHKYYCSQPGKCESSPSPPPSNL